MATELDKIDSHILRELQRDASQTKQQIADKVGLSQNACWRRVKLLEERGVIQGQSLRLDRNALGLGLTVFMMIRTRSHSAEWLQAFRRHVLTISDITDFYRIGGDYDYLLKIVTHDMKSYDHVYQRLIEKLDLESVTSYFVMEEIAEGRPLPL